MNERERESVCVCECVWERVCVCMCERELEIERVRECVCVCLFHHRARERKKIDFYVLCVSSRFIRDVPILVLWVFFKQFFFVATSVQKLQSYSQPLDFFKSHKNGGRRGPRGRGQRLRGLEDLLEPQRRLEPRVQARTNPGLDKTRSGHERLQNDQGKFDDVIEGRFFCHSYFFRSGWEFTKLLTQIRNIFSNFELLLQSHYPLKISSLCFIQ